MEGWGVCSLFDANRTSCWQAQTWDMEMENHANKTHVGNWSIFKPLCGYIWIPIRGLEVQFASKFAGSLNVLFL